LRYAFSTQCNQFLATQTVHKVEVGYESEDCSKNIEKGKKHVLMMKRLKMARITDISGNTLDQGDGNSFARTSHGKI
jgi:hypothetical protein